MQASTINSRLKEERERLKLSQSACADLADVSLSAWRGWERNRAMPAETLDVLGRSSFDVGYLISGVRNEERMTRDVRLTAQEAVNLVSEVMIEMHLDKDFSLEQVKSLVSYTIEQHASVEQVREFIESAYKVMGSKLPDAMHRSSNVARTLPVQAYDSELLKGCIEALEERQAYLKLNAADKASAINSLYVLCNIQQQSPRVALQNRSAT